MRSSDKVSVNLPEDRGSLFARRGLTYHFGVGFHRPIHHQTRFEHCPFAH